MKAKQSKKCLSSGKTRSDRVVETKEKFDVLELEVKFPGTAIALLKTEEKPILMAAAAALARFGEKSPENLERLFEMNIVSDLIPLIKHEDLATRRFALKLLAEMSAIPSVKHHLLESQYDGIFFKKLLLTEKDLFMQEYSSMILCELLKDTRELSKFIQNSSSLDFAFEGIRTSTDPDVKKNYVEIVHILTLDPILLETVLSGTENFDLPTIYELLREPYPEIQHLALTVIRTLVARNKDDDTQEIFRQSRGIEQMLDILGEDDYSDLHPEILNILGLAMDNGKTMDLFLSMNGIVRMLKYLDSSTEARFFPEAFDILVRFTNSTTGRKVLHSAGIGEVLMKTIEEFAPPEVYKSCCYGISRMLLHTPTAEEIIMRKPVQRILEILKNESFDWTVRHSAILALEALLKSEVSLCSDLLDLRGEAYLLDAIKRPLEDVQQEIKMVAVQIVVHLATCRSLRDRLNILQVLDTICTPFQFAGRASKELKIACCDALSLLCIEKFNRDFFLRADGPRRLYNLITDTECMPVRSSAVQLVQELSADKTMAVAFIDHKYLAYMLKNRSSAGTIPWETCIETLFNAHLPVKFAYTGRVSFCDITQNGFYVMRSCPCPFPVLEDFFRFKYCPKEIIYVINFAPPSNIPAEPFSETGSLASLLNQDLRLTNEEINQLLSLKYGRLQPDPYLCRYLELVRCKLWAAEPKKVATSCEPGLTNVHYIVSRVRMLAKFVVRQLSGFDPISKDCLQHDLEIHLKEIQSEFGSSIIPLGYLRVGSYLERALLFKVLADRICLPAALVRGQYGKAWVETCIPQLKEPEDEKSFEIYLNRSGPCHDWVLRKHETTLDSVVIDEEPTKDADSLQMFYPIKLMRPNYIVDLMHNPGSLIPLGTKQALEYTGSSCTLKYSFQKG